MFDYKLLLILLDLFSIVVLYILKEDVLLYIRGLVVFSFEIVINMLVGEGEVFFNVDIFGDI